MAALDAPWLELCVATGIGLLVGLERERRKGEGPRRIPAGIRSFAVVALLGAAAQLAGGAPLLVAAVLGVGALAVAAYWRGRAADPGVTTGIALLLVLVLGGMAITQPAVAAALGVALALLLASRARLHAFVKRALDDQEVEDFLVLVAATLVVLPMIPPGGIGPHEAFSPRTAWIVVILTMLIGMLGHVAQRLFGAHRGLVLAGFVSGFVSSAATIAAMGERARREPASRRAAVAGAVMSTVATVLQMAVVLGATSPATLRAMALPLLAAGVAAGAYAVLVIGRARRAAPAAAAAAPRGRAFSLRQALGFAVLLSAVVVGAALLQAWWGGRGVLVAAALAGFADAHAAAVSVGSLVGAGRLPVADAPVAVLLALSTNTMTKLVAAASSGGREFTLALAPGLLLVLAAAWAAQLLPG